MLGWAATGMAGGWFFLQGEQIRERLVESDKKADAQAVAIADLQQKLSDFGAKPPRPAGSELPDAAGWGLGIWWLATPCGRIWGHTGGAGGYSTYSWHSADGRRQVTLAENLANYAAPGQVHPIDRARDAFLTTAMCGPKAPVYDWP